MAQLIAIATMPILTRIYDPKEFGILSIYVSFCSIAAVAVTGRYEQAILIPKEESGGVKIALLSMIISLGMSYVFFIVILLFNSQLTQLLNNPDISNWLYVAPITILLMGTSQSLSLLATRNKQFKRISLASIAWQAITQAIALGLGAIGSGILGLISGNISGLFAQCLGLFRKKNFVIEQQINTQVPVSLFAIAKKYVNFPRILLFAHLINAASIHLIFILLGSYYGAAVVGFYALSQKVVRAPMGLIGNSFGQVFKQQASELLNSKGSCRHLFVSSFFKLAGISFLPFAVLWWSAPVVFIFIFGENWETTGQYVQALTPMFFMQFVSNPICCFCILRERQVIDLTWQIFFFSGSIAAIALSHRYGLEPVQSLKYLAAHCCLMYVISLWINWYLCGPVERSKNTAS